MGFVVNIEGVLADVTILFGLKMHPRTILREENSSHFEWLPFK